MLPGRRIVATFRKVLIPFYSGALARKARVAGAPWVRNIGYLCIQEI